MRNLFLAAGANSSPHSLDFVESDGLVVYAAGPTVAVLFLGSSQVSHLIGRPSTKPVDITSVCILGREEEGGINLASGKQDGSIDLWEYFKVSDSEKETNFCFKDSLVASQASVSCIKSAEDILVACSSDGFLRIWNWKTQTLLHSIEFSRDNVQLSLSLQCFEDGVLIISGGVEGSICLHFLSKDMIHLTHLGKWKEHKDWVSCIDSRYDQNTATLYIASADHSGAVKLWNMEKLSQDDTMASKSFTINQTRYSIYRTFHLDAHEDWIFSVQLTNTNPVVLLTASADQTISQWKFLTEIGFWSNEFSAGDITGKTMKGFCNGIVTPDGSHIVVSDIVGAVYIWQRKDQEYVPILAPTGHFGAVVDIAFEPSKGKYILSVSKDQTTRLWASIGFNSFHEIARPQTHGYNLSCISFIPNTLHRFVSGAEEKALRMFDAPSNVCHWMQSKLGYTRPEHNKNLKAHVPELSLSNTMEEIDGSEVSPLLEGFEESLASQTLYPEVEKFYGHVYEVYSVCTSPDGKLMASSALAKQSQGREASAHIWDISSHKLIGKLSDGHTQTITALAFSKDSRKLLTVSKDRHFSITSFENSEPVLLHRVKAHSRVIWSSAWIGNDYFVTGSRDHKVKIWREADVNLLVTMEFEFAVTAVAVSERGDSEFTLAVGLESGLIRLFQCKIGDSVKYDEIPSIQSMSHCGAVKRIQFFRSEESGDVHLVSCGEDRSVRLHLM